MNSKILFTVLALGFSLALLGSINTASALSGSPNVFEILSEGGDITFIGGSGTQKMIVIGPPGMTLRDGTDISLNRIFSAADSFYGAASVDVPDGATITGLECIISDLANFVVNCQLIEYLHDESITTNFISDISSDPSTVGIETFSDNTLSHLVDRDTKHYQLRVLGPSNCGDSCSFFSAKITYTVPSGMIVGGTFYPVDNVSLMLAFTLVNSYWMAPIAVGAGVGIYVFKKKF